METGDISVRHADELKQTKINEFGEHTLIDSEETDNTETQTDRTETEANHIETVTDNAQTGTSHTASENESHDYRKKLRSHRKQVLPLTCINDTSSET